MFPDLGQYVWPVTVLIIFLGMLAIVWRALGIAHDLAKTVLSQSSLPGPKVSTPPVPAAVPPVAKPAPLPAAPAADVVIDQGLVNFIKKMEGFRATAYWDYKQYSIGYGTRATSATETITEAEAEARLRAEIAKADQLVTARFPNLPKGQHQALIDLTYNAGPGWEDQSLGRAVAAQNIDTIKADILQYNHAGGVVNAGLTARREAEVSWFDNPL